MINKIVIIGLVIFQFLLLHRINYFPNDSKLQESTQNISNQLEMYQNNALGLYENEPIVIHNNIYNYNFNLIQYHYHCDNNDSCSFRPYSSQNDHDSVIFPQILPPFIHNNGGLVIVDSNSDCDDDNDSCISRYPKPSVIRPSQPSIIQPNIPYPQNHNIVVNLTLNRRSPLPIPNPSAKKKTFWNNFEVLLYFMPIVGIILTIVFCS